MSASSRKALQCELLRRVAEQLTPFGFDSKPVGQSVYRAQSIGRWVLHLAFIDHNDDFDITADVAIRVDAVERMINESDNSLPPREKSQTATVGAELGNLVDGRQRRWTIRQENEIDAVATAIVNEFAKFGLPYLERMSNLDTMLGALAANDASAWRHSPIHGVRCKTILALTILLLGPDQARKTSPDLEAFLRQRNDFALEDYRRFSSRVLGTKSS